MPITKEQSIILILIAIGIITIFSIMPYIRVSYNDSNRGTT